jgi:hypothetical protein
MDALEKVVGAGEIRAQRGCALMVVEQFAAGGKWEEPKLLDLGQSMRGYAGLAPFRGIKRVALPEFAKNAIELLELKLFEGGRR